MGAAAAVNCSFPICRHRMFICCTDGQLRSGPYTCWHNDSLVGNAGWKCANIRSKCHTSKSVGFLLFGSLYLFLNSHRTDEGKSYRTYCKLCKKHFKHGCLTKRPYCAAMLLSTNLQVLFLHVMVSSGLLIQQT